MYSRKRYSHDLPLSYSGEYDELPEDDELYGYNLPPRYDGNRFGRRTQAKSCHRCEEIRKEERTCAEMPASCESEPPLTIQHHDQKDSAIRLIDGIGGEELLIISLILVIAGSEDNGELLFFLILLLLHG